MVLPDTLQVKVLQNEDINPTYELNSLNTNVDSPRYIPSPTYQFEGDSSPRYEPSHDEQENYCSSPRYSSEQDQTYGNDSPRYSPDY